MATIYVVSHKKIDFRLPEGLVPIYVGPSAAEFGGLDDQKGESICTKNKNYCELTAQYWVWKNLLPLARDSDVVGFCHYRRFFSGCKELGSLAELAAWNDGSADNLCRGISEGRSLLVKTQVLRSNFRESLKAILRGIKFVFPGSKMSLRTQYGVAHSSSDLEIAVSLLPTEFKKGFDNYLDGCELSPYNMFCSTAKDLNDYFSVLFPWMFDVERNLDISTKSSYEARIFGFLAERFASYYFSERLSPRYSEFSFLTA